jgi:hypothetical protein
MANARDLINDLIQKGWSVKEIARAVSRDPKLIRNAASGARKFANGIPALERLVASPTKDIQVEVPRRASRHGGLANVRGGLTYELGGGHYSQSKSTQYILDRMKEAATAGRHVDLSIRYSSVTWKHNNEVERHRDIQLYQHGYRADTLLERVEALAREKGISESEALEQILHDDTFKATSKGGSPGCSKLGKVEQYTMHAFEPVAA